VILTARFDRALTTARELHAGQVRKGTTVPYLSHLLAVTAEVLADGGGEDEAIAALLHDAVEDQGGEIVLRRIRDEFGAEVARIVEACSDDSPAPGEAKRAWQDRKTALLGRLESADEAVLRVATADKLHNARETLLDLRIHGPSVWKRFSAGRDGFLWYYGQSLVVAQRRRPDSRVTRALEITMQTLATR
jgi:(p)ppGpp synthase/HD superfamily hydrolase